MPEVYRVSQFQILSVYRFEAVRLLVRAVACFSSYIFQLRKLTFMGSLFLKIYKVGVFLDEAKFLREATRMRV